MEIKFNRDDGSPMNARPNGLLQRMAQCTMTRFLVVELGGFLSVTLHPYIGGGYVETHKDLWQRLSKDVPGVKFVGAGYYYPRGEAEFDSGTCKQFLGFDRPQDKDLQEKILESIQAFANRK